MPEQKQQSRFQIAFLPIWGKINETIPIMQMRSLDSMGIVSGYGTPGTFFNAVRTCLKQKPKIIHFDWIHQYTLAEGIGKSLVKTAAFVLDIWIARRLFGVNIVWTLHNIQHHEKRPRNIEKWVQQWFASQCIRIRILGKGIEKQVEKHLKVTSNKLAVIPEGSFIGWYPQTVDNQLDARVHLHLEQKEKIWLYFGNLRPYKGVEALIDYFSKNRPAGTRLIIAGNPYSKKYAESLQNRANDNPHIRLEIRKIADEEISVYFHAADLVVLPFKDVLNSSTVNLAMSFAKPVVAAAKGLVPFRLQKQPELLFSQNNPLERVLDRVNELEKNTLEAIGAQNLEEVERYTWNDFAEFLKGLMHG